ERAETLPQFAAEDGGAGLFAQSGMELLFRGPLRGLGAGAHSYFLFARRVNSNKGDRRANGDDQQQENTSADGRSQTRLATTPASQLLGRSNGPRANRLIIQNSAQFLGQFPRRAVAPLRILLQTLRADRFQVARQFRIQQAWRN